MSNDKNGQGAAPAIPVKPYLIRALAQWCEDNGYSPYLMVQFDDEVEVPSEFVENGRIVRDISEEATHSLDLGNEVIMFAARFGDAAREIRIPVRAVLAIYPAENPQYGMGFPYEPPVQEAAPEKVQKRASFIQKVK